jgi:hypothetical protein
MARGSRDRDGLGRAAASAGAGMLDEASDAPLVLPGDDPAASPAPAAGGCEEPAMRAPAEPPE